MPLLRRATPTDADAVTACALAAYEPHIERIGQTPGPLLDDYAAILRDHHAWVFEDANRVIGLLVLMEKEGHILLDNVAVHPAYQGRGLGNQLMALAERETKRLGYSEIQLYTHEKMLENKALYRNLGYAEFARREERGLKRVYMRKRL